MPKAAIILHLHLPGALSRTEARRASFNVRASHLQLDLVSKSGLKKTADYTPTDWDRIGVKDLGFPVSASDALSVRVRIWDLKQDGTARAVPALTGKATVKASELAVQGPTTVPVKLILRVPVSEYD